MSTGDVAVLNVAGLVDERFPGFGAVGEVDALVINVAEVTRITSFGVRQWLQAMAALPPTITERYLIGCPTFFVDQLNMVLGFAGGARVLTVAAPFSCGSCNEESEATIDLVAERAKLVKGHVPDKQCPRCRKSLALEESPDSYFAFVENCGAASIRADVARLLAQRGLYSAPDTEKPPKIVKVVQGSVTYFRVIGTIGAMFRARPFLVGAEGEVVIDLCGVERFDHEGVPEWRRLLETLATQVTAITVVDVNETFLATAVNSLGTAENVFIYSVLAPYRCTKCRRMSRSSHVLDATRWPPPLEDRSCPACRAVARSVLPPILLTPLRYAHVHTPAASAAVIARRDEVAIRRPQTAPTLLARGSAPPPIASASLIGQTIGNFRVVGTIGRGGMGEVYRAEHTSIGTTVAIKVLRPEISSDEEQVQRFFNEARAVGQIKHAGTVKIFDVGFHNGCAYLIMELLDGESLGDRLRRTGRLDLPEVAELGRQMASVLDATHSVGIIHRDLKPDNIIIVRDEELASGERVKILDFGIAKLGGALKGAGPRTIGTMGTPTYMAPEQWGDSAQVDWRADAYALGCVVYEMCAGTPPFHAPTIAAFYQKHLLEDVPPLDAHGVDVPPSLGSLLEQLLAKEPDARPISMRHVVRAFEAIAGSPGSGAHKALEVSAVPDVARDPITDNITLRDAAPPPVPRSRVLPIALVVALLAVAGVLSLWLLH